MNRNGRDDQVGNPRRLLFVLSVLVMAGVIGVFVVAAIWPRADVTDPSDDSDFNTEASAAENTPLPTVTTSAVMEAARPAGLSLPDSKKTPGDVLPATAAQICVSGYSKSVRSVTTAEKEPKERARATANLQRGGAEGCRDAGGAKAAVAEARNEWRMQTPGLLTRHLCGGDTRSDPTIHGHSHRRWHTPAGASLSVAGCGVHSGSS